ncbi:MAG: AAA family ATPase, partial [Dolichospermum sp.]
DGSNIAGVLAGLPDEKKTEIENTLSEYLKDLPEGDIKKVWAEKVGRLGTDAMLYCQEEWKPGEIIEIDARSMSDGTLRFLAILTALLTRPEGSQIVIEEIDNGLHPSRAALLVKILKEIGTKRNIDILLTTHNPALLDAFGPEIVPFVVVAHRDSETGESKLTLLEDIDNFPKLFASYSLGQMTTKGAIERSLSHGE